MADRGSLPLRLSLAEVHSSSGGAAGSNTPSAEPEDAVIFVGISLVLGIASRHVLRGTRVPYTVALLVLGIVLGVIEHGTDHGLGKLGAGIRLWSNINPNLLLTVFLPALLFESSFRMEIHQIKKCMMQMILLAGPGVMISTFCLGAAVKLTFPYNWNWTTSLLLGGLLSATDPVAVVALLKELGASKKLNTIIEGESLMNDGTAIVVYQLFYQMVRGQKFNAGDVVSFLSKVSLGAVAIGLAFGIVSVLWLGIIFNDTVIEITLTLAVSYIAFYTAQDGAEVSGVLTVMTLGMFYAAFGRTAFKGDGQQSLHHFWEMVAYIANTLIFILSGVVIADGVLQKKDPTEDQGTSWGYLILLYVFVQLSRAIVVGTLYPLLRYFGYGIDWKESLILTWSGLRGAVALALSLSAKQSSDSLTLHGFGPQVGRDFVFFTGGIVFFTLILNGSTAQFLLHFLKMDKLSAEKIRVLNYTRYELLNKAMEAFGDLGDDEELGPADWPTVKKYIKCLNDLEGEQEHPHTVPESDNHSHHMNLKDMRVRLLNGVQAAYWEMLDEGRVTQGTGILLMQSVDEAMDMVSHNEALCDWNGLKAHVHFPSYYRFLQVSRIPQRLITYFTVERLESACYICAAFLRAHRIARTQLNEFIGESEVASVVIHESNTEGEEARKFLEDVRISFPQVLRVVKTKQATYSILKHLSDYLQNLEKVGLLDEKEMIHLDDAVQTDLKKLQRNPPLIKVPQLRDLLSTHPFLGALPVQMREPLEGSTKEILRMRGMTLYKEGSKPNGIWLVLNGVVKWTSSSFNTKQSLHPTFSHGSTLGLYEVLVGKPYLSDMITESVVRCCFVETEKIISLFRSDTDVENFLWLESSIAISKILLPRVFEKLTLPELRALIFERSRINVYVSDEVIEIPTGSICFLLEGFIRNQQTNEDLIASPAALVSSVVGLSSMNLDLSGNGRIGSFCHQGASYSVVARARVIFFDMKGAAGSESPPHTARQPSWFLRMDYPRIHIGEHGHSGLVSWPENISRPRSYHQNFIHASDKQTSFTSKAMELSIFGRTVDPVFRSHTSMPRAKVGAGAKSYPRVPTTVTPPPRSLVSVQSEGESLGKRLRRRERERHQLISNVPPNIPMPPCGTGKNKTPQNNSSDEDSGGEEVIVRIDSPSKIVMDMKESG